MKIYDSNFKNEIIELDFGNVNVGESKTLSFILFNENNSNASIELSAERVTLSQTKAVLGPHAKLTIAANWIPSLSLKESLKTKILISGGEIYV